MSSSTPMKNQMGIPEPCIILYLSSLLSSFTQNESIRYQNIMLSAAKMTTTRIAHSHSFL